MFNIQRRQGALILMGFVLVAGQCYFVMRKQTIRKLAVVEMLTENFEFRGKENNAATEKEPRIQMPMTRPKKELYELMDKYANATRPDINASFKRILFWNEVRAIA